MSLLLDALKRAEQAKLAKHAQGADEQSGRTAAGNTDAGNAPPHAPAVAHLKRGAPIELSLQEVATASATAAPSADQQPERAAAQNLFAAKQIAAPKGRPRWLLPAVAASVLLASAGGWYVWNEITRLTVSGASVTSAPRLSALQPPAATPAPAVATPPPFAQLAAGPQSAQRATQEAPLPATRRQIAPDRSTAPQPSKYAALVASLKQEADTTATSPALKVTTSLDTPRLAPGLQDAYNALASGNYAEAGRRYADVLRGDSHNPDAHLGLATALARSGDGAGAAREYRTTLDLDPRNGYALAGLLALSTGAMPGAAETELRTLVSRNPGSAALVFSLGNLYATQLRWTEAQQAFFDAHRLDPDNAAYLYNLAVSLDHLNQPRLALEQYQRVLAAKGRGASDLDTTQVSRRIDALKLLF
jgi:tetratricopeptide (TPR) repeat protein